MLATAATSQSVRFVETDLETAISMAERQQKNLFIETYTTYCKPCKKMEIEFRDPELASYFNNNFINVRVNMEGDRSEAFQNAYQVVFLPTMIFATAQGGQRMKIDHLVSSKDLLKFAKHINGDSEKAKVIASSPPAPAPKKVATTPATVTPKVIVKKAEPIAKAVVESAKAPQPKTETVNDPITHRPEDISTSPTEGKILYVMGQDADNLPPEILREEAYFRMQLMDGSHQSAAEKYLATQADWGTEQNVKFIHDFINDSRSDEFLFMLDNRTAFDTILGKEQVDQTLTILVNKELERGFPRPDYNRAKKLYSYIRPKDASFLATNYQMNTLFDSDEKEAFLKLGGGQVNDKRMPAELLYKYSSTLARNTRSKKDLRNALSLAERAVNLENNEALYPYNCAQISILLKDKKKASYYIAQSLTLAGEDAEMMQKLVKLEASLKAL